MAKMVYSLLLGQDVVAAIDLLAAQNGYSRSAYVNHILAEHACLSTAEKRTQQVMEAVQQKAQGKGMRGDISAGGMLTLRTALRYKYNPALFYALELTEEGETAGELRVLMRTQNPGLVQNLQLFFDLWNEMERQNLPNPPSPAQNQTGEKKYVRILRRPPGTEPALGQDIAAYISLFDECIKTFFDYPDDIFTAMEKTRKNYLSGLAGLGGAAEF